MPAHKSSEYVSWRIWVLLILNVRLERSNRVSILLIRTLSLFQHLKQIAESHEGQGEFEPETLLRIIVDEALGNSDRTFGVLAAFCGSR